MTRLTLLEAALVVVGAGVAAAGLAVKAQPSTIRDWEHDGQGQAASRSPVTSEPVQRATGTLADVRSEY